MSAGALLHTPALASKYSYNPLQSLNSLLDGDKRRHLERPVSITSGLMLTVRSDIRFSKKI